MKKYNAKKLTLKKQKIASLSTRETKQIVGGISGNKLTCDRIRTCTRACD